MWSIVVVMEYCSDPRTRGDAKRSQDLLARVYEWADPFVLVYLSLIGDNIGRCTFQVRGCRYTVVGCSILTELIAVQKIYDCLQLKPADILRELGELPPHRHFCATVAMEVFHGALRRLISTATTLTSRD